MISYMMTTRSTTTRVTVVNQKDVKKRNSYNANPILNANTR